jgi:hypothetical protein
MAQFTNFQDVLPDPNNTIGDAGQVAGTAGPGYASVRLSSENSTMRTRTNSGRLISRAIGYHLWKISIEYNPMTREDFQRIYNFLIHKRGGLTPFFVSLPQYRLPQDSTFASFIGTAGTKSINASGALLAGTTSAIVSNENSSYLVGTDGTPKPGDLFNIDGANSNHKKAYMVTRVELQNDYHTASGPPNTTNNNLDNIIRIHFTPGLAKAVADDDDFRFYNPLIKVILSNDIQEYSLGTNGLYKFGLQLEEVQ